MPRSLTPDEQMVLIRLQLVAAVLALMLVGGVLFAATVDIDRLKRITRPRLIAPSPRTETPPEEAPGGAHSDALVEGG